MYSSSSESLSCLHPGRNYQFRNIRRLKMKLAFCQSLSSQLAFARQKLLNPTIPFQLRAISYLRISCSARQKFYCLESENRSSEPQKTPYLSLLNSLSEYQVEWWNNCEISEAGILSSNLAVIARLLQPVTQLHQQQFDL